MMTIIQFLLNIISVMLLVRKLELITKSDSFYYNQIPKLALNEKRYGIGV